MRAFRLAVIATALLPSAFAQLAPGKLLIATNKLKDADLSRSVILLIQYDKQAALGLIVNRPSDVPVSEVFPELAKTSAGTVHVWAGGPVTIGIRALVRAPFRPADAQDLFDDVSVISTKSLMLKLLSASTPHDNLRVYAGYVGWTSQQLRNEVASGLWLVRAGEPGAVFDPDPAALWTRLLTPRRQSRD